MRGLVLVVVGCFACGPDGASESPATRKEVIDWFGHQVTIRPGEVSAAPGEVIDFTIVVKPPPASNPLWVQPGPWVRIDEEGYEGQINESEVIGKRLRETGKVRARALAGPYRGGRASLRLTGAGPTRELLGTRVHVRPAKSLAPVTTRVRHDPVDLDNGLTLRVDGRRVEAIVAEGTITNGEACGETYQLAGPFIVHDAPGYLQLLGFIGSYRSDSCFVGPEIESSTPRFIASFEAPRPGPVEVVIHRRISCAMCMEPAGWDTFKASARVE